LGLAHADPLPHWTVPLACTLMASAVLPRRSVVAPSAKVTLDEAST
jgi:hypothetical protein